MARDTSMPTGSLLNGTRADSVCSSDPRPQPMSSTRWSGRICSSVCSRKAGVLTRTVPGRLEIAPYSRPDSEPPVSQRS